MLAQARLLRVRVQPVRQADGAAVPRRRQSAARDARRPRLADQRARRGHRRTVRRLPGARRGVAGVRPRPRHPGQRRGRAGAVPPRPAHGAHRRRPVGSLGLHRPPRRTRCAATRLSRAHHRRRRAPRPAAPVDRVPRSAGTRALAAPRGQVQFACATVTFGAARRSGHHRGQHAAFAVRFSGHPRRRAGADDRRHRRAGRRRGRRVGVRGAPPRPLSAPPAVGALPRRGVDTARRVPRPRRRRGVAARVWPDRTQHPAAGRRPQPDTGRAPGTARRGAAAIRWSPTWTRFPRELRGLHPDNPVNRVRGGGTQLELSPRVRGISPRSPLPGDDGLAPATSALVQGLVATAHSWELPSA